MAKSKKITCVGYVTLTGVAVPIGRKVKSIHTAKIGFAGKVVKTELSKAAVNMKQIYEKQLREDYPENEYTLKMSHRVTVVECDMLLGEGDEAGGE